MRWKAVALFVGILFVVIIAGCSSGSNSAHVHRDGSITPGIKDGFCLVLKDEETYFDGPLVVACDVNNKEVGKVTFNDPNDIFEFPVTGEIVDGRNTISIRFLPDQSDWAFAPGDWTPHPGDTKNFVKLALFEDGDLVLEHFVKFEVTGERASNAGNKEAALGIRYTTAYYDYNSGSDITLQN